LDCIGLLVVAARDCGGEVEDLVGYPAQPDGFTLVRHLVKYARRVPVYQMQVGDIAVMGRPHMTHVGILGDRWAPFSFLHVPTRGSCVEVAFGEDLDVRGIWRWPN
jgi:hypothetical protein